jgi:hypothetical protein
VKVDYVPLLQVQRDLHGIPRGMERFRQYLRTIANEDGTSLGLPSLVTMNPMGKDHVTALLEQFLAMDADGIAARVLAEAVTVLENEPGDFKATLVIADDLKGGWTNRYATEFTLRFPGGASMPGTIRPPKWTTHFWVTGVLWSSEAASERAVSEAILTALYRAVYLQRHGAARNLREMLAQEGYVMSRAGCTGPTLDEDDIEYTREVIEPFLEAGDMRTAVECLFGDAAAQTLGFTPHGLSPWAGLAVALHDARCSPAISRA